MGGDVNYYQKKHIYILVIITMAIGYSNFRDAVAQQEFNPTIDKNNSNISVPTPRVKKTGDKAIFGDNSMQDYYQVSTTLKEMADSTVAFVPKDLLIYDSQTKTYKVAQEMRVSMNYGNIDKKEDFVNENILSFCSGAYLGKSYILSAGHCIDPDPNSPSYFKNVYIVFGWRYEADNTPAIAFSQDQVYTIKEIKIRKLSSDEFSISITTDCLLDYLLNKYEDYSLSVLDREPVNKEPLIIDKNPSIKVGDKAFTIGYPLGMAVKIDKLQDSEVKLVGKNTFETNIDAFGGNSGGPVFNSETKKIIGILVTGFGGEFEYELKQDVLFNVRVDISVKEVKLIEEKLTLYVNPKYLEDIKKIITQQYNGEFNKNGDKYMALIKAGTKMNNRDFMFGVIARLFWTEALNKGKLVRYPQDNYGTGVMKIPDPVINEVHK